MATLYIAFYTLTKLKYRSIHTFCSSQNDNIEFLAPTASLPIRVSTSFSRFCLGKATSGSCPYGRMVWGKHEFHKNPTEVTTGRRVPHLWSLR